MFGVAFTGVIPPSVGVGVVTRQVFASGSLVSSVVIVRMNASIAGHDSPALAGTAPAVVEPPLVEPLLSLLPPPPPPQAPTSSTIAATAARAIHPVLLIRFISFPLMVGVQLSNPAGGGGLNEPGIGVFR